MYYSLLKSICYFFILASVAFAQSDLFFSEYVEGSDSNQALEIYNGTNFTLDLAINNYAIEVYEDANLIPVRRIDLTGTFAKDSVLVIVSSGADSLLLSYADQEIDSLYFDGNDAIVLLKGNTVIDAIGQIGADVTEWGFGNISTRNNTLVRKFSITEGDTNPNDAFDPVNEWNGYPKNTFIFLGSHYFNEEISTPVINEFVFNHEGNDKYEYIETFGDPNTDYTRYSILVVDGTGNSPGSIIDVFQIDTTNESGFWFTGFMVDSLQDLSSTYLLVSDFYGRRYDDIDLDDNGIIDTTFWSAIEDGVSYLSGESPEFAYSSTSLSSLTLQLNLTMGGFSRIPNGFDDDAVSNWRVNDFQGEGLPGYNIGTTELKEAYNTPLQVNKEFKLVFSPYFVINEVNSLNSNGDNLEFIEFYDGGTGSTSLDSLILVFYDGETNLIYSSIDLSGFSTNANGYFVVGNSDVSPTPPITFADGLLQDGADAVAVYKGTVAQFAVGDILTTTSLIDAVVYDSGQPDDPDLLVLLKPGQPQVNENEQNSAEVVSISRIPNGGNQRETTSYTVKTPTPGRSNIIESYEIYEIQGSGMQSPLVDQLVSTDSNIVFLMDDDGFYMQTPSNRSDNNSNTSDGIFVKSDNISEITVGSSVSVEGIVKEIDGFTVLEATSIIEHRGITSIPEPKIISSDKLSQQYVNGIHPLEKFEGMRVFIINGYIVGPTDVNGDVFVNVYGTRAYRERGIKYPGLEGLPIWDGNPEVFKLARIDGVSLDQIPTENTISVNVDAKGAIFSRNGDYILMVDQYSVTPNNNVFYSVRKAASNEVSIATFNLNGLSTSDSDARFDKFSNQIIDYLKSPSIIAVQEVDDNSALQELSNNISQRDNSVNYESYFFEGNNSNNRNLAFMIRDSIQVDSVKQIGKNLISTHDSNPLFKRPPLVLYGKLTQDSGAVPIVFINIHLESREGINGLNGELVRNRRFEGAKWLSQYIGDIIENDENTNLIVGGNFNAFQFSDGYFDVVGQISGSPDQNSLLPGADEYDPNLINIIGMIEENQRYSIIEDGNSEAVDHFLLSQNINSTATELSYARINSDAPLGWHLNYGEVYGSALHDPLVLYLESAPNRPIIKNSMEDFVANEDFETIYQFNLSTVFEDPEGAQLTYSTTSNEIINSEISGGSFLKLSSVPNAFGPADVYVTASNGVYSVTDHFVVLVRPIEDFSSFTLISPLYGDSADVNAIETNFVWESPGHSDNADIRYSFHLSSELGDTVISNLSNNAFTLTYGQTGNVLVRNEWFVIATDGFETPSSVDTFVVYLPQILTNLPEEIEYVPTDFVLNQNYPNPFNPSTTIKFGVPQAADVTVKIYDILGQEVMTLVNQNLAAGFYTVNFDASNLISGMYIYRIQANGVDGSNFTDVKKMLLVK